MRLTSLALIAATLLMLVVRVQAQSEELVLGEPWPIVERCFTIDDAPASDASFEGTLALTSPGRLHALRAEWDTPRILAFFNEPIDVALSPNAQWFAIVNGRASHMQFEGARFFTVSDYFVDSVRVVSTLDGSEYVVPWENRYEVDTFVIGRRLHWLDNTHFLYSTGQFVEEWLIVNPFTEQFTVWGKPFTPSHFSFIFSPDTEKALTNSQNSLHWVIYEEQQTTPVTTTLGVFNSVVWHPSSSIFAGLVFINDTVTPRRLTLFNLEGEISDYLYELQTRSELRHAVWSSDGRYFAFTDETLLIVDLETQQIINTCLMPADQGYFTVAWSPDNQQIAIVDPVSPTREILIFDIDRGSGFVAGYHQGEIIGWRADEDE